MAVNPLHPVKANRPIEITEDEITEEQSKIINKISENAKVHNKDFIKYGVDMSKGIKIYKANYERALREGIESGEIE